MEILLAWVVYLAFGVACVALGWAWLAPRLPRTLRLAVLWLMAGLAVVALAIAARIPHDYRTSDLAQYEFGLAALVVQMLVALIGLCVGLAAAGRTPVLSAALFGVGLYLAGVGLALYWMMNGQATVHAPALVFIGSSLAVAAAGALASLPRWSARILGVALGLAIVFAAEAMRGMGSRGDGPAAISHDVLPVVVVGAMLLIGAGVYFLRAHGRRLIDPFRRAGIAFAGTALVMILRGPGEWSPGPDATSTTLYGLPLTLLVIAVSLVMLTAAVRNPAQASVPSGIAARRTASALRLVVPVSGLLLLLVLLFVWHPAAETCAAVPYLSSSASSPDAPVWATAPGPPAMRGAPDIAAFNGLCAYHAPNAAQVIYTIYPSCKWAQIDPNYPLVQATGVLSETGLSNADSPWIHTTHDLLFEVMVDQPSAWLVVGGGKAGNILSAEAESGNFPLAYRPVAGDRVTIAGRWIFDCGHNPRAEIHPAAVVASEHEEWRADAAGGAQQVNVLQVWMNGAPGVVHVPLPPFDMQADFPAPPASQPFTPTIQVVQGTADSVRWAIDRGTETGSTTQAAIHITPPDPQGSAYFELLLGYDATGTLPTAQRPVSYTVAFDEIAVHDDLRHAARNTTGVPMGLAFPSLGFAGSGRWIMQATVNHNWRNLLDGMPVSSGRTYSLASVPAIPILASDDEHLNLAITGYAENDPSDGVDLASGSVSGPLMLSWDAGPLAGLCCGTVHSFTPPGGAWTLSYHVMTQATRTGMQPVKH